MITQIDTNNGLRWRNLTEKEGEVLIGRYRERNKLIFFLYCFAYAFGIGLIIAIVPALPWEIGRNTTYEDILGNIVILLTFVILFIAIPAIHYTVHFRKEIRYIKRKRAYICETKIVEKFEDILMVSNNVRSSYNFTVELPFMMNALTVNGGKGLYENSFVGDVIYVVFLDGNTADMYYAYPANFAIGGYYG